MPLPIQVGGAGIDLSPRVAYSEAVAGSPADATETVVCQVTVPGDIAAMAGVVLVGYCSLTVGASGTSILTRIRRDSVAGTAIKASGATTATAAQLVDRFIVGVDESPTLPNEVYVLTLTVGAGAAASTVSAATLLAVVV